MDKEILSDVDYGKKLYSHYDSESAKTKMKRYWFYIIFFSIISFFFSLLKTKLLIVLHS